MADVKILIVDDNADFRHGVKKFLSLEPGIQIVGEAENGRQAVLQAKRLKPDLVLMDVKMPKINGLDAIIQILKKTPVLKIIMLSQYDDEEYKRVAIHNGAIGYVVKSAMVRKLMPAIRKAVSKGH
jgi:DNA-binding NarL/FixJ family response regulator